MASETTGWSEDGQWFWDGSQWNEAISPDGNYIYDGTAWAPFTGTRTPMPDRAFGSPATGPPAASPIPLPVPLPAPLPTPWEEYPAWMDPTEVERLKAEKAKRAALAREGSAKVKPVDWEKVHEAARTGGKSRLQKTSNFLLLVVLLWSLVIVLALYALFIYLPAHPISRGR